MGTMGQTWETLTNGTMETNNGTMCAMHSHSRVEVLTKHCSSCTTFFNITVCTQCDEPGHTHCTLAKHHRLLHFCWIHHNMYPMWWATAHSTIAALLTDSFQKHITICTHCNKPLPTHCTFTKHSVFPLCHLVPVFIDFPALAVLLLLLFRCFWFPAFPVFRGGHGLATWAALTSPPATDGVPTAPCSL